MISNTCTVYIMMEVNTNSHMFWHVAASSISPMKPQEAVLRAGQHILR